MVMFFFQFQLSFKRVSRLSFFAHMHQISSFGILSLESSPNLLNFSISSDLKALNPKERAIR